MKMTLRVLLFACVVLSSCGDSDGTDEPIAMDEETIVGSWQLVEQYISPGGPTTWMTVENGYTVTFNEDLSFLNFNQCLEGTYTMADSTMAVSCAMSSNGINLDFEYNVKFESDNTIVISNNGCIEPCQERFDRAE